MASAVADDVEARAAEGSSEWAAAGRFEAGVGVSLSRFAGGFCPSEARLLGSKPVEDVLGSWGLRV